MCFTRSMENTKKSIQLELTWAVISIVGTMVICDNAYIHGVIPVYNAYIPVATIWNKYILTMKSCKKISLIYKNYRKVENKKVYKLKLTKSKN